MVRRHHQTTKPNEPDSPGMDEERSHHEPDLEARRDDLFRRMDALAAKVRAAAPGRPTGRGGPMLRRGAREARFAVVAPTGYARDEVDSVVEDDERRFDETRVQLERTELNLAEADGRVQALEARVSELEEWGAGGSPLPEMADELLRKAKEIGRELESHVLSQAESKRDDLKQTTEAVESARGRAGEIVAKARRDREELGRTVEESRRQVDQFLQDSRMMAEQRGRGVWEKAQGRLREPVLELEHLNEQRRAMLKEILELQELVDTSSEACHQRVTRHLLGPASTPQRAHPRSPPRSLPTLGLRPRRYGLRGLGPVPLGQRSPTRLGCLPPPCRQSDAASGGDCGSGGLPDSQSNTFEGPRSP